MSTTSKRSLGRTHSVLGLTPMLAVAQERGIAPASLLAHAGIPAQLLDDPHGRVPIERELVMVREMLRRIDDRGLGFAAGRRYQLAVFGLLGSVVRAVPTVRDAIRLFQRYLHMTYTPFAVAYFEKDEQGWLCFSDDIELGDVRQFYLDRDMSFVLQTARTLWPDEYQRIALRVHLDYPEPTQWPRYRHKVPCTVEFGAEMAAIVIDPNVAPPSRDGQHLALQLLEEHLEAFTTPHDDDDFVTRVRNFVSVTVATRRELPKETAAASALGMTARTLRRRLAALNIGFRAIADDVLAQIACRHLREGDLPVAGVAERLGYAESASFVRAFRRWTDETPHSYRMRLRASGSDQ